jgi:hypothetical protein
VQLRRADECKHDCGDLRHAGHVRFLRGIDIGFVRTDAGRNSNE